MASDSALPPVAHVLVDVPPGSRRPQSLANPEPVHHTNKPLKKFRHAHRELNAGWSPERGSLEIKAQQTLASAQRSHQVPQIASII